MANNQRDGSRSRSYFVNPENATWGYEDAEHGLVVHFTGGPSMTFHREADAPTYEGVRRALRDSGVFEAVRPVAMSRPDLP